MGIFKDECGMLRTWVFMMIPIIGFIIAAAILVYGKNQVYMYKDLNGNVGEAEYCYQSVNYKIMQCESKDGHKITVQEYWIKNETEPNAQN